MYSLDLFAWRNVDEFDSNMQRYQQGKSTLKPDNRNLLQSFEFENRIGQFLWYIDNVQQEYVNLETSMDEIIRLLENDNAP